MKRGTLNFGGSSVQVWLEIEDGEVRASSVRPKQSIKFREFAGKYESEVVPQMKPASQASITSVLGILSKSFGARKLSDIGTEEIQKFVTSSPYSPKTLRNQTGVMRMVWNKARAWGYVKHDPFEFLSMPRQPLTEARSLSIDEVRAIIRKTDEPFKTMLWILAETGIRGGELCGLYRSDVDARSIRIARSAFRKQIQTPKTVNAVREIMISGRLAEHLSQVSRAVSRTLLPKDALNSAEVATQVSLADSLLFSMPDGRPWDNGEIVRRLKPVLGTGVGLHAFRHFNASIMASVGVPEHIRRERLGHSAGNITARYTHSDPSDHSKWSEIIGNAICTENVQSFAAGAD
jgi:integrase